jgi:hypothetical protein
LDPGAPTLNQKRRSLIVAAGDSSGVNAAKVPEPFRRAMDITALDHFDCQFYGSIARQYIRQAMLLLGGSRRRSAQHRRGLERRCEIRNAVLTSSFPQAEIRPRWTEFPGRTLSLYFGGCRPGLFAHLSIFSATFSWLGRIGGLGSLGLRDNWVSLSICYLLLPT